MHEQLKFNLLPQNKDVWQPIVAAQAYGTFFCIYMQFCDITKPGDTKDTHYCTFKIQNFRGPITLGLKKPVHVNADLKPNPKDPIDFILEIGVQPFNLCQTIPVDKIDFKKEILKGHVLDAQYRLEPPPKFLYEKDNPNSSMYLNPYDYYRDGDTYLKVCLIDEDSGSNTCDDDKGGTAGGICDMTRSLIIM